MFEPSDTDSDVISVSSEATSVSTMSEPIQILGAGVQVMPSMSLKDMPDLLAMQERLAQQQRVLDEARKRQAKARLASEGAPSATPSAAPTGEVQNRLFALLSSAQSAAHGVPAPAAAPIAAAVASVPAPSAAAPSQQAVDDEVRLVVEDAGMAKYLQSFAGVSFDAFIALSDRDLQQMGLTAMGPRLKLLRYIQAAAADIANGGTERQLRSQRIAADKAVSGAMRLVDQRTAQSQLPQLQPTYHLPPQQQQQQQQHQPRMHGSPFGFAAAPTNAPPPGIFAPPSPQASFGAPGLGAPFGGGLAAPMVAAPMTMPGQFNMGGSVCVVCRSQPASVVFEPCEHMCVCQWCRPGPSLRYFECPVCMVPIVRLRAGWHQ